MRVVNENTFNAKASTGQAFFIDHVFLAVPDGETVYIRHKSGLKNYLHSILDVSTVGQWRLTSYSGTVYTNDGTLIPIINRKSDSLIALQAEFWHTPIISAIGMPRLDLMFGSGNNPAKATTSAFGESIESVFAPEADVLLGFENLSGSTQYLSVLFNVHEESGV